MCGLCGAQTGRDGLSKGAIVIHYITECSIGRNGK